ncbi:hypothetical protein BDN70DRAFT_928039 [Pholiota conissans]|uniref:Uncharacterized protein n=1 Tax=Pholiota conissans TaxID=109636 RepID=A0A9P5ZB36_9AGAR|nr:hypothetical protein BDN70DRAFT_928039 [Pholiota conissans]
MNSDQHILEVQQRVAPLKRLTSHKIPCILWDLDAMHYHHYPYWWEEMDDLHILVPDNLLESSAAILVEDGSYDRTSIRCYKHVEHLPGPDKGEYEFPRSIRLVNSKISCVNESPSHILIIPQSYYGLDAESHNRFQSLVPPMDPSYNGIRIPKFNTILEGFAHFALYPPGPSNYYFSSNYFDICGFVSHRWEGKKQKPVKKEILSEIETEDGAWYMVNFLFPLKNSQPMNVYLRQKSARRMNG